MLGTLASLAVARYRFFGRETISFLVILPIALPGIVTGMALNATFNTAGISLGLLTIIVGHATFCIVVIYNNAVARLRRTSQHLEEASADLGADTWQTFRYVTFPQLRSALLAGALLAFALSFDEVIVTTFTAGPDQTLPIWILEQPLAAEPAAGRERRRGLPDPALDDPRLPGDAADAGHRRGHADGRRRAGGGGALAMASKRAAPDCPPHLVACLGAAVGSTPWRETVGGGLSS